MTTAIVLDDVNVVFGGDPKAALPLMDAGLQRAEIQARTHQVLGVHACSLEVKEGEIVVLMGLSGSGKSTLLRTMNRLNKVVRGRVLVADRDGMTDVTAAGPRALRRIRRGRVRAVVRDARAMLTGEQNEVGDSV